MWLLNIGPQMHWVLFIAYSLRGNKAIYLYGRKPEDQCGGRVAGP